MKVKINSSHDFGNNSKTIKLPIMRNFTEMIGSVELDKNIVELKSLHNFVISPSYIVKKQEVKENGEIVLKEIEIIEMTLIPDINFINWRDAEKLRSGK